MIQKTYFLLAVTFLFSIQVFSQKKITLQSQTNAGNDAFVWKLYGSSERFQNVQNRNFGDRKYLKVVYWTWDGNPGEVQTFIKFNLPEIENINIISAKLSLFGATDGNEKHSQLSGENDFVISRVIQDWNENEITWENKPSISNQNNIIVQGSDSANYDFIDIDVTKIVADMYSDSENSFGFNISLKTAQYYRMLVFASFDFENISKRPKLEIVYDSNKIRAENKQKNNKKSENYSKDNFTLIIYDNEGNEIDRIENINIKNKNETKSGIYNFNLIKDKNVKASGKAIVY
jgi:hypothetical protein